MGSSPRGAGSWEGTNPKHSQRKTPAQIDEAKPKNASKKNPGMGFTEDVYLNPQSIVVTTNILFQFYGIVKIVGVSFCVLKSLGGFRPVLLCSAPLSPRPPATSLHPLHPNKLLAAISPNPSITPLMNGRNRLIAKLDASARNLARFDNVVSKMASVTDGGATGGSASVAPEGPRLPSPRSCPRR